ncbi:MAG: thermonuclease family protein, partial [Alphaproteobacteria bacterium]
MKRSSILVAVVMAVLGGWETTPAASRISVHAAAAAATEIVGRPRVVDADTLDFAGRIVDLYGIVGPAPDQTCRVEGRSWPCGMEARWAAINRVGRHWVACVPVERDSGAPRTGVIQAICYLAGRGGPELNAWLVARGWALADPATGGRYFAAESMARRAARGLWR